MGTDNPPMREEAEEEEEEGDEKASFAYTAAHLHMQRETLELFSSKEFLPVSDSPSRDSF